MCSLTDFIEMSLGRCGGLVSTATVTAQGASLVDPSVRGGDFSWPKTGTSRGHQRGHQLAKNGDFLMATDTGGTVKPLPDQSADDLGSFVPSRVYRAVADNHRGSRKTESTCELPEWFRSVHGKPLKPPSHG
jgi:hypothetical protein